jgi:hypothetical protein
MNAIGPRSCGNVDRMVAALVASQHSGSGSVGYEAAKKRLVDAEARSVGSRRRSGRVAIRLRWSM